MTAKLIYEWISPSGIIAIGVLWGLIQQFISSRRTAHAVKVLAVTTQNAHAIALVTADKLDGVATTIEEVKMQTNGMSHRLEILAREAGKAEGVAEEKRNVSGGEAS
jgi:hypothetical protein